MPPRARRGPRSPFPRGAARAGGLVVVLAVAGAGCGPRPAPPAAAPTARPSAPPPLPFGILPLGGVAARPLRLGGPYRAQGPLRAAPPTLRVFPVPFNPVTAVVAFARGLGLRGRPIALAGGALAYGLGSSRGYQLTTTRQLTFALHPDHPVEEIGTTPTLAEADRVARAFFRTHHLLGGSGLRLLPAITRVNGSDRRITYALQLGGLPVVDITGAPRLLEADVATDSAGVMAVVGAGGQLPLPIAGRPGRYRTWSPALVLAALNRGALDPAAYRLQADLRPYPPAAVAPEPGHPALVVGDVLAVVESAGYAVPVYVLRVAARPGTPRLVTCALPESSCLPLRYRQATTTG